MLFVFRMLMSVLCLMSVDECCLCLMSVDECCLCFEC
jgi:hypothetical protein